MSVKPYKTAIKRKEISSKTRNRARKPTAAAVRTPRGSPKSADIVDKLVSAVGGKFNGLKFDAWRRTAQSVISMRHPEVAYIFDGQRCPINKSSIKGKGPKQNDTGNTRSRGQQPGTEEVTPAEAHDEDREKESKQESIKNLLHLPQLQLQQGLHLKFQHFGLPGG